MISLVNEFTLFIDRNNNNINICDGNKCVDKCQNLSEYLENKYKGTYIFKPDLNFCLKKIDSSRSQGLQKIKNIPVIKSVKKNSLYIIELIKHSGYEQQLLNDIYDFVIMN